MARWVKSKNSMRIFKQTATPAVVDGLAVGDIWIDINSGAIEKVCTSVSPVTFAQNSNSVSGTLGTTTNDAAAAGYVGELVESIVLSGSGVSFATGTGTNITSISLTAGDWNIFGNVNAVTGAATSLTNVFGGINTTSATLPVASDRGVQNFGVTAATYNSSSAGPGPVPGFRVSLSGTTTYYLVIQASFTSVNNMLGYGRLWARRIR